MLLDRPGRHGRFWMIWKSPRFTSYKGAIRIGAKGAEAPLLAKSKFKKDKISDSLIFFVSQWSEVAWFGQFMVLKIDYDAVKLRKVTYDVVLWRHKDYVTENTSSKWRHENFLLLSSSLSKILVALLTNYRYQIFVCV